jgi:transglutaminase-like putative cysteine protease
MKNLLLAVALATLVGIAYPETPAPFSLKVVPSAQVPFGPLQDDGSALYTLGFGAELDGDVPIPGLGPLSARASVGYLGIPIADISKQLTIASFGVGPAINIALTPRLAFNLAAGGGYALLVGPTTTAGNPFAEASALASYSFSPALALGLGASYRMHFNSGGFDYQGLGVSLGASFALGKGPVKPRMQIIELKFDPIYPVFYKYYDTNSAGTIRLKNGESGPIKNLRVSLLVPQFMSGPKLFATVAELKAGEESALPIYALFTDSIISLTEDTKVDAKITYSYTYLDSELKGESDISLRIYNRNAMTWDDDRRAAAFVSPKDPTVLGFSKTAAGIARDASQAVNNPFRQAMGIFQALEAYGLRYVPDPTSPFTDQAKSRTAVDYLQFPAQTLAYKAGDCDDLSILYAAMLEATGVEAAFITIPGHIYLAFDLGMDAAEAKASLSQVQDLVFKDGNAWVPVEVTMVRDGFLAAWKKGAQEWREADALGKAAFYPLQDAWKIYEAAAYIGGQAYLAQPSPEAEGKAFSDEMGRFVDQEVKAREPPILKEVQTSQGRDPRSINKLGVLYARYALYDKALDQFTKAAMLDYGPGMVNLGNVILLKPDPKKARIWFERAYAKDPTSVPVLVGLARACQAADDGAATALYYAKLKAIDPKTAERYAYLASDSGGSTRASDAAGSPLLWNESN